MTQLRWRVRLVAERPSGVITETELACIERDEQIGLAELGLRVHSGQSTSAALIATVVDFKLA